MTKTLISQDSTGDFPSPQEQRLQMALGSEAALCRALHEHVDLEAAARGRAQEVNFRGRSRGKPVEAHDSWENHRKKGVEGDFMEIYLQFFYITMENHNVSEENLIFQWLFSLVLLIYQRVYG